MTQAANLAALGTNAGTTGILPIAGGGTAGTGGAIGFKNRVINGNMAISQRGTSFSSPNTYTLDRFGFANTGGQTFTVTQSSTAPTGFTNSLSMTNTNSVSAGTTNYQVIYQAIEGYNIADLGWGTASAKTVSVSFWVNSSVTGSYGLVLRGGSGPSYYVLSYSIPVANTWTYITATVPGCTTDTWNTTNSNGITLYFDLGVGSTYSASVTNAWATGNYFGLTGGTKFSATNGATFAMTGLQLEVGTAATNFDVRSYTTELQLCQRYYEKSYPIDTAPGTTSVAGSCWWHVTSTVNGYLYGMIPFKATKRAIPTMTFYSYTGTVGTASDGNVTNSGACGINGQANTQYAACGNTSGGTITPAGNNITVHYTASAEI